MLAPSCMYIVSMSRPLREQQTFPCYALSLSLCPSFSLSASHPASLPPSKLPSSRRVSSYLHDSRITSVTFQALVTWQLLNELPDQPAFVDCSEIRSTSFFAGSNMFAVRRLSLPLRCAAATRNATGGKRKFLRICSGP